MIKIHVSCNINFIGVFSVDKTSDINFSLEIENILDTEKLNFQ